MPRALVSLLVLLAFAAVAPAEPAHRPPWVDKPRAASADTLFFVGLASGAESSEAARDAATKKALAEISAYFGVDVASQFSSVEREANGEAHAAFDLRLSVQGDEVRLRQVRIEQVETQRLPDSTWEGYAEVSYPRAEFERTLAEQAHLAHLTAAGTLALYRQGTTQLAQGHLDGACSSLKQATTTLAGFQRPVELSDAEIASTTVLAARVADALASAEKAVQQLARTDWVQVRLTLDGKVAADGPSAARVNDLLADVTAPLRARSRSVGTAAVEPGLAERAKAGDGEATASIGASQRAARLLFVEVRADFVSEMYGQFFATASAQLRLVDAQGARVLASAEVPDTKGGHVKRQAAVEKALANLRPKLAEAMKRLLDDASR